MNPELLYTAGVFYLVGEIDQASTKEAVEFILTHTLLGKHSELKLIINSEGGDVASAFALMDIMQGSPLQITTIAVGSVASAALMIFMAGDRRVATPNTMFLSHQFSAGVYGKEHELLAARKMLDQVQENILRHYRIFTGLEDAVILKELLPSQDVWLTAEEAMKYNICDQIVESIAYAEQLPVAESIEEEFED